MCLVTLRPHSLYKVSSLSDKVDNEWLLSDSFDHRFLATQFTHFFIHFCRGFWEPPQCICCHTSTPNSRWRTGLVVELCFCVSSLWPVGDKLSLIRNWIPPCGSTGQSRIANLSREKESPSLSSTNVFLFIFLVWSYPRTSLSSVDLIVCHCQSSLACLCLFCFCSRVTMTNFCVIVQLLISSLRLIQWHLNCGQLEGDTFDFFPS